MPKTKSHIPPPQHHRPSPLLPPPPHNPNHNLHLHPNPLPNRQKNPLHPPPQRPRNQRLRLRHRNRPGTPQRQHHRAPNPISRLHLRAFGNRLDACQTRLELQVRLLGLFRCGCGETRGGSEILDFSARGEVGRVGDAWRVFALFDRGLDRR